jgi:hypothetical protein
MHSTITAKLQQRQCVAESGSVALGTSLLRMETFHEKDTHGTHVVEQVCVSKLLMM